MNKSTFSTFFNFVRKVEQKSNTINMNNPLLSLFLLHFSYEVEKSGKSGAKKQYNKYE
jgi:hypothetical protein